MMIEASTCEEQEVWLASDLEEAFIGFGDQGHYKVAVYDYEKCVEVLMKRDGGTRDEVEEHMSYNVTGSDLGRQTPVFVNLKKMV